MFYEKILKVLERMPEDAAYRRHTHNIVHERLAVVNSVNMKITSIFYSFDTFILLTIAKSILWVTCNKTLYNGEVRLSIDYSPTCLCNHSYSGTTRSMGPLHFFPYSFQCKMYPIRWPLARHDQWPLISFLQWYRTSINRTTHGDEFLCGHL